MVCLCGRLFLITFHLSKNRSQSDALRWWWCNDTCFLTCRFNHISFPPEWPKNWLTCKLSTHPSLSHLRFASSWGWLQWYWLQVPLKPLGLDQSCPQLGGRQTWCKVIHGSFWWNFPYNSAWSLGWLRIYKYVYIYTYNGLLLKEGNPWNYKQNGDHRIHRFSAWSKSWCLAGGIFLGGKSWRWGENQTQWCLYDTMKDDDDDDDDDDEDDEEHEDHEDEDGWMDGAWLMVDDEMMGGDHDWGKDIELAWNAAVGNSWGPLFLLPIAHVCVFSSLDNINDEIDLEQRTSKNQFESSCTQHDFDSVVLKKGLRFFCYQTSLDFLLDHSLGPQFSTVIGSPLEGGAHGLYGGLSVLDSFELAQDWWPEPLSMNFRYISTDLNDISQQMPNTRNTQCRTFFPGQFFPRIGRSLALPNILWMKRSGLFGCRICCLGSRIGCVFDSRALAFLGCQQGRDGTFFRGWCFFVRLVGSSWSFRIVAQVGIKIRPDIFSTISDLPETVWETKIIQASLLASCKEDDPPEMAQMKSHKQFAGEGVVNSVVLISNFSN